MHATKRFLVAIATLALLGSAVPASAGPVEDFCDRSPRDGKARWYPILCE